MPDTLDITPLLTGQVLALVRSALWLTPPDLSWFENHDADMEAIGELSRRQAVDLLAGMAAIELPDPLRPSREQILAICAEIERNRRTHHLIDTTLAEAAGLLAEAGCECVLLKGQAYSRLYPEPHLRRCGDIDLYVGERDFDICCHVADASGWEPDKRKDPHSKHRCYYLHGVHVELHRHASVLPSSGADRRFRQWCSSQLTAGNRYADFCGVPVKLPSQLFDVVFVFLHLYNHFINGGVGLRQLCDWVMVLDSAAGSIDLSELEKCLDDFNLLKAWKMLTPIAVEDLGLNREKCPFYSPGYRSKADKILEIIMLEGNFGNFAPLNANRPPGRLRSRIHNLIHNHRRLFSLMPVDPAGASAAYLAYAGRLCRRAFKIFKP